MMLMSAYIFQNIRAEFIINTQTVVVTCDFEATTQLDLTDQKTFLKMEQTYGKYLFSQTWQDDV